MEMLIDVQADKAELLTELLHHLLFVKIKSSSTRKDQVLQDLEEAVEQVRAYKRGEIQLAEARELINKL